MEPQGAWLQARLNRWWDCFVSEKSGEKCEGPVAFKKYGKDVNGTNVVESGKGGELGPREEPLPKAEWKEARAGGEARVRKKIVRLCRAKRIVSVGTYSGVL